MPPSTLSSPHPSLSGKLIAHCPSHLSWVGGDEKENMKVYVISLYIRPGGLRKPACCLKSPFQHCEDLQWDIHSYLKREKRLRENRDKHLYNSSHKSHQTDALDQNNTVRLIKLNPISTQITITKYKHKIQCCLTLKSHYTVYIVIDKQLTKTEWIQHCHRNGQNNMAASGGMVVSSYTTAIKAKSRQLHFLREFTKYTIRESFYYKMTLINNTFDHLTEQYMSVCQSMRGFVCLNY